MDTQLHPMLVQRLEVTANYVAMVLRPQDELLQSAMAAYAATLAAPYLDKAA